MKKAVRSVKNVTKGYSDAQVKVRKATSNEAWGPEGADMAEIAQMTFDSHDFLDVMDMLDRRMNDRGKMWRHVYKALQVFDYCVHSGSENVVRWGKDNLYVIKSLREFQHIDDEGIDQGANIRSKAKELTALLQDDERLRQERSNRSNMQQRMNSGRHNTLGSPVNSSHPQRRRNTRPEENDDELRRAIEASKRQADEDERKRRQAAGESEEDIAKAIKLSREEEELRQSRLEEQNSNLLFDDSFDQPAPQPQQQQVYQQQQQVDFWGNPVDMNAAQQQQQSTGYLQNVYSQPTGFLPQQQTGFMQPQPTAGSTTTNGFNTNNPYAQAQPQFALQTGGFPQSGSPVQMTPSNNPYGQQQPEALKPMPTGSNNPFAQFGTSFNQQQSPQPQQQRPLFSPSLSTLSEQQQQSQFPTSLSPQNTSFSQSTPSFSTPPPKQQSSHQNKLDFLLSQGNPMGQDTFGNTGELRVPAHFQRTGYVNSAGQGLRPSITGVPSQQPNNPFFTGQTSQGGQVRPLTQSSTGPAYSQQSQYGQYGQQNQQGQTGSLIDF